MEQKDIYTSIGMCAEYVGESQTDPSAKIQVVRGEVELVFINPESMLCNPHYRDMLLSSVYKKNLIGIAMDDAH